jgi:Tfp pilus assembly protein PilO
MIANIKAFVAQGHGVWVLAIGGAAAALSWMIILLGPLQQRYGQLSEAAVGREQLLARNLRIVEPRAKAAVERDYQQYGDTIRRQGSTEEDSAAFLSELDRLAGANQIALLATKPQDVVKDPASERYAVEIELEADMAQLIGFLHAVESAPGLLRAERLSIDAKGGKAGAKVHVEMLVSKVVTL